MVGRVTTSGTGQPFLTLPGKAARAETPSGQHVASFTYTDDNLLALAASKFPGVGSDGDEERQAFDTFFKNTQEGKKADFSNGLQDDYTPWLLVDPVFTQGQCLAMGMSFGEREKSLFAGHLFRDFLSSRA